jgi:hypothetical protein
MASPSDFNDSVRDKTKVREKFGTMDEDLHSAAKVFTVSIS